MYIELSFQALKDIERFWNIILKSIKNYQLNFLKELKKQNRE